MGHSLSTPQAIADFRTLAQLHGWNKDWIRENISEYAATKDVEAIAESFGIYTREDYQPGTLPSELETFLKTLTL